MATEERLDLLEQKVRNIRAIQDQTLDVLGITVEGQARLSTRTERIEENFARIEANFARMQQEAEQSNRESDNRHAALEMLVHEIGDKLNGLISVVDGFIGGKRPSP